jgi:hypothetical protein
MSHWIEIILPYVSYIFRNAEKRLKVKAVAMYFTLCINLRELWPIFASVK